LCVAPIEYVIYKIIQNTWRNRKNH